MSLVVRQGPCRVANLCVDIKIPKGQKLPMLKVYSTLSEKKKNKQLLPDCSRFLLKSDLGNCELRGDDLVAKQSDRFITIYHEKAPNSEAFSHIHLNWKRFNRAVHGITERKTHYISFLEESDVEDKPELALCKIYLKSPWSGPTHILIH